MNNPELIILDTNLLMLFIVGNTSVDFIRLPKRLQAFNPENYHSLSKLISDCELITIPHVLTETSNLLGQGISGRVRDEVFQNFKDFVIDVEERHILSKRGVQSDIFYRLGLTDAILLEIASTNATLITIDGRLFSEVIARGYNAINFLEFIES